MKKILIVFLLTILWNNIYCENNLKISDKLYRQISGVWGRSYDTHYDKYEYSWGDSIRAISITIDLGSNYPFISIFGVYDFDITSVEELGDNKVLLKYVGVDKKDKVYKSIITIINYDILRFDKNDPNIEDFVFYNGLGPQLVRLDGPHQLLAPTESDVYLYKEAYKGNDAGNRLRVLKKGERLEKLDRELIMDSLNGKSGYWIKVKTDGGEEGYCHDSFLEDYYKDNRNYTEMKVVKEEQDNSSKYTMEKYYTPTIDNLRFRESPTLDGKFIRMLKKGEKLVFMAWGNTEKINDVAGTWLKVKTDKGEEGWCFDAYLEPYDGVKKK